MLTSLLLVCSPALHQEPEDLPLLRPGETIEGEITDEDPVVETELLRQRSSYGPAVGWTYLIRVDSSGPYHIDLRSYAFDAYLVLRDTGGAILAEDDDGLVEWHSRIVFELAADTSYQIEACALHGLRGPFELCLEEGQAPELSPVRRRELSLSEARRRVEFAEQGEGPESEAVATALNSRALVLEAHGLYAEARPLCERALAIRKKALGPEHILTAQSLGTLGAMLQRLGLYDQSRPLYEHALAIDEKAFGPEHTSTATTLNNLASLLHYTGLHDEARPLYERALAIKEKTLGPEHILTAASLDNLAVLLQAQGLYDEARPLHERALAIYEKTLGPEHHSTANSLGYLALLLKRQGLYDEARLLHERALAIDEKALGPEHPSTSKSLNNLAMLLQAQGLYEEARPLLERTLAITEKTLGPEHPSTAITLNNLALLLDKQGLYDEARPLYERSLVIRENALGPNHPLTASCLGNLAALLEAQGLYDEARPLYERALAIYEKTLGPEHHSTAISLNNLAVLFHRQGFDDEARPLLERALAIDEKTLGPEHPSTAIGLNNLAQLLADLGRDDQAWVLVRRSSRGRARHLARVLASQGEHENYTYLAQYLWHLELSLSLAASSDLDSRGTAAYEELLAWKGQVMRLLTSSRSRLGRDLTAEQERILGELRRAQSNLSALALTVEAPDRPLPDERFKELRERRAALELEWVRSLGPTEREEVSFESLVSKLPPKSALVDFFLHRHYTAARREGEKVVEPGSWSEPHLNVWISHPGDERPAHLDLGPATLIEERVKAFLGDLTARRGVSLPSEESVDVGAGLRALLWEPIAGHLEGVETVLVSPDGFLGTFSFEVLKDEDGNFLIERQAFVYLEDAASLVHTDDRGVSRFDTLLSVGAIDFRRRAAIENPVEEEPRGTLVASSNGTLRGGFDYWESLPATAGESQAVVDLHEDVYESSGLRVHLQGKKCTEERLKRELPRYAVAHLATHGFFQPQGLPNMWEDALNTAGKREMQMHGPAKRLVGDHPGLLSGLVCAGVNADPEEGRDDGYLTAEEVGWLDLSGVELVVLSACETGLGRAKSGEGLIGLRRAFRAAGVKTVISSLWSVRDESTADLMRAFYRNLWAKDMGKLEALRSAQLAMLKKNRIEHGDALPSTWGAFVMSGDWK